MSQPYPAAPPPSQQYGVPPQQGTRFVVALGAAAIWIAVSILVTVLLAASYGVLGDFLYFGLPELLGKVIGLGLIVALIVWAIFRKKQAKFWQLVLVALPFFLLINFISNAGAMQQ